MQPHLSSGRNFAGPRIGKLERDSCRLSLPSNLTLTVFWPINSTKGLAMRVYPWIQGVSATLIAGNAKRSNLVISSEIEGIRSTELNRRFVKLFRICIV
jgi:hypothetical protein